MLRTLITAVRQQGAEAGPWACRAAAVGAAAWAGAAPPGLAPAGSECSSSSNGCSSALYQSWDWRRMAHTSRRCSSGQQWEVLRNQARGGTVSQHRCCQLHQQQLWATRLVALAPCYVLLHALRARNPPSSLEATAVLPPGCSSKHISLGPAPLGPTCGPTRHHALQGFQVNPCNSRLHPSVTEVGAACALCSTGRGLGGL